MREPDVLFMRRDLPLAEWDDLGKTEALLLDVRNDSACRAGHVGDAYTIPLEEPGTRLDELPANREIWLICGVGQRAYYAPAS